MELLDGTVLCARVFRFAIYRDDIEFMRESGYDQRSTDEMMELLQSSGSRDSLEELCDGPFRPKRRLRGGGFDVTRFSDGSFPVFYCAVDEATARAEAYHWFCHFAGTPEGRRRAWYQCVACDFGGRVKDLRPMQGEWRPLTYDRDYEFCNTLGAEARAEDLDGLMAPSVRRLDGTNVAVFRRSAISGPEIISAIEFAFPAAAGE